MMIKTERTGIRLIVEDDWRQIGRIWKDFNQSQYARYDRPHNTDDSNVRARIAKWAEANRSGTEHIFFAVCLDDTIIGYCAFNKRDNGYEIGYCFDSAYHGKGYAKESISALFPICAIWELSDIPQGRRSTICPPYPCCTPWGFVWITRKRYRFTRMRTETTLYLTGAFLNYRCDIAKQAPYVYSQEDHSACSVFKDKRDDSRAGGMRRNKRRSGEERSGIPATRRIGYDIRYFPAFV